MSQSSPLFTPIDLNGLELKNRITMAPMSMGYGKLDGTVSPVALEHYRRMSASGAAMIVVENAAIHSSGADSPKTMRIDHDDYIQGLAELAAVIRAEGARALIQINHTGRYSYMSHSIAPSPVKTGDVVSREMSEKVIETVVGMFASAAWRAREAGFEGIEIHGAMGYLIAQFLSPRTNLRSDSYGGALHNRMRFPLTVMDAVREAVGKDYPIGFRFLADEWLPDGLRLDETTIFAGELARRGVAYLSVSAGTIESLYLPECIEKEKQEAYLAPYAEAIKKAAPGIPVIIAGRIQKPETANAILEDGKADLIGLARVLFADPLWPKKAAGIIEEEIVECDRACSLCAKRATLGLPGFCSGWDRKHRKAFLKKIQELN